MSVEPPADEARLTEGPFGSPVAEKVHALLAPVVATADVELLDVEWTGGTLRIVLDHSDGVTTDSLTAVNRLISPILDQHDPVPGRYTLEVSSPGVERPLRRADHYRRAIGETVVVKTVPQVTPRRVKGGLQAVSDDDVTIEVSEIDGVEQSEVSTTTIPLVDIASARTVFDWGPTPKQGGQNKRTKKGGGSGKGGAKAAGKRSSSKQASNKKPNPKQNRKVGHE